MVICIQYFFKPVNFTAQGILKTCFPFFGKNYNKQMYLNRLLFIN